MKTTNRTSRLSRTTFTLSKENVGNQRTYTTEGRLISAIRKAGATEVTIKKEEGVIEVTWPGHVRVQYKIAKDGTIDPQLAWDME